MAPATALLGLVALRWVVTLPIATALATACTTGLFGAWLARLATARRHGIAHAIAVSVLLGALLGMANVPVAFLLTIIGSSDPGPPALVVVATLVGAPYGFAVGALLGLVVAWPVVAWSRVPAEPKRGEDDGATVQLGLWLAGVAMACAGVAELPPRPIDAFAFGPAWPLATVVRPVAGILAVVGVAWALVAWARRRARIERQGPRERTPPG